MDADSIEQVINEYLQADTGFKAKFEGIYWLEADAGTAPYIVYWLVDDAGINTVLGKFQQGEARIQFDLWDTNKIRGVRLRDDLAQKVRSLNEYRSGYHVMVTGITEQTIQRASDTDPYHFVVDGIVRWRKE